MAQMTAKEVFYESADMGKSAHRGYFKLGFEE